MFNVRTVLCPHLSCQCLACLGFRRLRVKVQCLGCFFSLIPRSSTKVVREKERCAKVELSAAFHTEGPLRSSAAPEVSSGRRNIRMHIAETSGIRESAGTPYSLPPEHLLRALCSGVVIGRTPASASRCISWCTAAGTPSFAAPNSSCCPPAPGSKESAKCSSTNAGFAKSSGAQT